MITGEIRNKVDAMWNSIWAGGITNPLTVIEQVTYLIFIRSLDQKEMKNEAMERMHIAGVTHIFPQTDSGQSMRWSRFKEMESGIAYDIVQNRVFPAIKAMKGGRLPDIDDEGKIVPLEDVTGQDNTSFVRYMEKAAFAIPTPELLQTMIIALDKLYEEDLKRIGQDVQGDLYEYMLSKINTSGTNGQFRTPRHIREMMVELARPTLDDVVCDPACGTGGFLISTAEYVRKNSDQADLSKNWHSFGSALTGFDIDEGMLRISSMNLMLHSIDNPNISYCNSISKGNTLEERFTLCLANPPFTGKVNKETINSNLFVSSPTDKTELLFVKLFIRILKKGGRCVCIVPTGVLFKNINAAKSLRRHIVEDQRLLAVISMPSGVFKPYSGVTTAILVFIKTDNGGTDDVWFYDMQADGFSLDDRRSPVDENDIPDIVSRYANLESERTRTRSDRSFMVSKSEIAANDYDFSFSKYRKVDYVEEKLPSTQELVSELKGLVGELEKELESLEKML